MFHKLKGHTNNTFLQKICCRDYDEVLKIPMDISEGE